jgi:hypothetical protein
MASAFSTVPDRHGRDEAHEPAGDAGVAAVAGEGDLLLRLAVVVVTDRDQHRFALERVTASSAR